MQVTNTRSLIALALSTILCTSCAGLRTTPRVPKALDRKGVKGDFSVQYTLDEFNNQYSEYKTNVASGTVQSLQNARRIRDGMINRIRVDIEMNYKDYEAKLFSGTELGETAGDFLAAGLTLASTITNGARVKTVISAVATAVQADRLSVDKNFFRQKTIETILSKMQANRETVKQHVIDSMLNSGVDKYTFEEAWVDLVDFFYAGTLQGAIQALAEDAGKDAVDQKAKTRALDVERYEIPLPTPDEASDIKNIRDAIDSLQFGKNDVGTARKVLTALHVNIPQNAADGQIWDLLRQQLKNVYITVNGKGQIDDDQVRKLKDALQLR
ncbi:MAG TPA: hypothetical protein VEZ90_03355 [Blastocatellia bacterium]|nr:hypothetical protein [Blastocatellia bacterium]